MEFTRKKIRGKNRKVWKESYDESRRYRIIWRKEVFGIAVQPAYQVAVRCYVKPLEPSEKYWDFAGARRPYKTMKAAVEACEAHKRIWDAFIALGQEAGRRQTKLAELVARSRVGTKPMVNVMLRSLPVWALKHCDRGLLRMLFAPPKTKIYEEDECEATVGSTSAPQAGSESSPLDPGKTSPASEPSPAAPPATPKRSSKKTQTSGPAKPAKAGARSSIQKASACMADDPSITTAKPAKARAAAATKRAAKSTKTASPSTKSKSPSTAS